MLPITVNVWDRGGGTLIYKPYGYMGMCRWETDQWYEELLRIKCRVGIETRKKRAFPKRKRNHRGNIVDRWFSVLKH